MVDLQTFADRRLTNLRSFSETIALGDLWREKPCAIFFLRRLGCSICRSYIRLIEAYREKYEKRGCRLVCISFESFGEGSDSDRSFEKGDFWNGPIYKINKEIYEQLFGRKKLMDNFFGLLDIDKEAYARSKGTPGNLKGDGFQLGGQFVLAQGGSVLLEHRQKVFGDDAKPVDIFRALQLGLDSH
jgi:prostamide/prostaglandin F2alpha synthase